MYQPRGQTKSKKDVLKEAVDRSNLVLNEFNGLKMSLSQTFMDFDERINELRREVTNLSLGIGASVDLIADIIGIPLGIIGKRFNTLCQNRSPFEENGKIKGDIEVNRYNF